MNEQESFWAGDFGREYIKRNDSFDNALLAKAWKKMLEKSDNSKLSSILECGSNIGRNLAALRSVFPDAALSLIEVNSESFRIACERISPANSFNGPIRDCDFDSGIFDLVFSCGVLIHVAPYDLYVNMKKMYELSRRYLLFCEYFSREPEMKKYRGFDGKLFKMDFGSYFLDNFKVKFLDCGFLWSRIYADAGFGDITWWLFEKK